MSMARVLMCLVLSALCLVPDTRAQKPSTNDSPAPLALPLVMAAPRSHELLLPLILTPPVLRADRFGVDVLNGNGTVLEYDVSQLRIGWYHAFQVMADPPRPNGIEFVQMIRVGDGAWPPDWDLIADATSRNPGSLWLIGNEPDRAYFQDDCTPEVYAARYGECHTFLHDLDPSARVSAAGIVQPSTLRLRWLDLVLQAYETAYGVPMPVDAWNIHVQILPERGTWGASVPPGLPDGEGAEDYQVNDTANVSIFVTKVILFRTWMRDRGYRDRPLIISEYGVLQPSGYGYLGGADPANGDRMLKEYMSGTFDYLLQARDRELGYPQDDHRLVQRWAWYSLNGKMVDWSTQQGGFNGSLFDWHPGFPGSLTQFGLHFRDYVVAHMDP